MNGMNRMNRQEFQKAAMDKLDEWFGDLKKELLQAWYDEGIMYAVVKTNEHNSTHLYFFRIFSLGNMQRMEISQDKKIEISSVCCAR